MAEAKIVNKTKSEKLRTGEEIRYTVVITEIDAIE